jgi:hypothetical protein
MRSLSFVPVLLVIAALAGYAAGARPVRAQAEAFPLRVGETVNFSFTGGGSHQCRIEDLKGGFALCGNPAGPQVLRYGDRVRREEWVNLAAVEWIITLTPVR